MPMAQQSLSSQLWEGGRVLSLVLSVHTHLGWRTLVVCHPPKDRILMEYMTAFLESRLSCASLCVRYSFSLCLFIANNSHL